jgi:adenylosuccinate lyase
MTQNLSQNSLLNISPIDGRYQRYTLALQDFFSEKALIEYRVKVEVEYLISLSEESKITELPEFEQKTKAFLRKIYEDFSLEDAEKVKEIEKVTNHDVKAVEYFLKEKIKGTEIEKYSEFIHFCLTSEDVNNLSFSLMWKEAVSKVVLPKIQELKSILKTFAEENKNTSMLSLTHGQPATPTTFGKEIAVFVYRLNRQIQNLEKTTLFAKFGGATGTWGTHKVVYPEVDWLDFSDRFVSKFGLELNPLTTQIVPSDTLAENYNTFVLINNILVDFSQDIWLYISREILGQKKKEGEIGSSAMPHKINPINFENAEGNLKLANSIFGGLVNQLQISRMQRDLTGSTVIRNQGTALAHSFIAYQNVLKGLERITVNQVKMEEELNNHWEILAEPIQTVLRKLNYPNPYETLKELTRGQKVTKENLTKFIQKLEIPKEEKAKLLELTPVNYVGLSEGLVEKN